MDPSAEEKARRVRSLLSSYYGGGVGGPSPKTASLPAIDRDGFDHDAYVTESVRDVPLAELQARCVSMAGEIKQLDGDMQMLVYENYSKFIVATDTVKQMRTNVATIESRVEELTASVDATAAAADAVNLKLSSHREQIEQLNGVRALIKKLQAVFDLPAKLRTCADTGALALAVRYHVGARPLLAKYGDAGAFVGVKRECDAAMKTVEEKLRAGFHDAAVLAAARRRRRREMHEKASEEASHGSKGDDGSENADTAGSDSPDPSPSTLDASECVELLERLGTPSGELQGAYLASRRVAMDRSLGDAESAASLSPVPDARAFVVSLSASFLEDFRETAAEYAELFKDREPLVALGRELLQRYFGVVKLGLAGGAGSGAAGVGTTPARGLMAALAQMAADLSGINRLVPEIRLGDRAAEVVETATRERVGAAFRALELKLADAIERTGADVEARVTNADAGGGGTDDGEDGAFLLDRFEELRDATLAGVKEALADTRSLLEERPVMVASWREEFESLVRGHAASTLDALLAGLRSAAGPPPVLLVHARLASFMETDGVPTIARTLDAFFPAPKDSEANTRTLFAEKEQIYAQVADELVRAYAAEQTTRLSLMIRQSVALGRWDVANEPRDVSPVVKAVVASLVAVETETAGILEDGGYGSLSALSETHAAPATGIDRGVADLFRGEGSGSSSGVFDVAVEPTRAHVLGAVTKSALKSFVECVRGVRRFNRCGYQQTQADATYLDRRVRRFVSIDSDVAGVVGLCGAMVSAAGERSEDPTPLDPFVVDRILSQKASR